jgi:hypothetical protein
VLTILVSSGQGRLRRADDFADKVLQPMGWRLSPLFDEGAQNFKRINLSILALSGFVAGRMRACLPRHLVTNGTIFLPRRYVLVNVPFASGVRVPALTPVPLATPKSAGLKNSAWLPVLCCL